MSGTFWPKASLSSYRYINSTPQNSVPLVRKRRLREHLVRMSIHIFLHVWSTHLDTLEKCACRFCIDILILFRRGSRKFCQMGSNSATLTVYFFRGERIQIPLKAGQHRHASETQFNSSLPLRISRGSGPPVLPLDPRSA